MENKAGRNADRQMSESFLIAAFLSLAGGLQDGYTYFSRGKVFANAQTGNIVLLSQCIYERDFSSMLRYLIPVLAFALGVAVAELIRQAYLDARRLHWRQLVLGIEMLLLVIVGLMPNTMNLLANTMVSFSCAMQVQAFRKVKGYPFASTMCIGNMRSGMEALCAYRKTRSLQTLHKAACYWGIILLFALGAGLSSWLLPMFGIQTIWFSAAFLLVGFVLMFF